MLTPEALEAIAQRCAAATAGPWNLDSDKNIGTVGTVESAGGVNVLQAQEVSGEDRVAGAPERRANALFAAHARSDVPKLVEEVRRLRRENEEAWGEYESAKAILQGLAAKVGLPVESILQGEQFPNIGTVGLVLAENYLIQKHEAERLRRGVVGNQEAWKKLADTPSEFAAGCAVMHRLCGDILAGRTE